MSLRVSQTSVWNSKTQELHDMFLYPTQIKVLNAASKNYIYELGTGSGKTYISLHHYVKHSSAPLLIIMPPAKKKEGGWRKSIDFFCRYYDTEIEYEELSWGMLSKRWQDYKGYYVIVDECHTVKNSTSQVGKAFYNLTKIADGYCLLSATPMSNGWEDSINYFKAFSMTKNKTQFLKRYALQETKKRADGRMYPVIVGWQHEDDLKGMWQSIAIQREASHFVELPQLNEIFIDFKKSSTYKELEKERLLEINGELVPFDTLPKLNAGRRKYANPKEKISHLEMLIDTDENILIFYNFNSERDDIRKLLHKYKKKVYEVSGHGFDLPDDTSRLKNSVTLVQYQAGGAGIELQYCSIMVMFSPTYSYQDYIQSIGRAYRPGGHGRLTMYKYKVKGTIETEVYRALDNKRDFKDELYREEVMT